MGWKTEVQSVIFEGLDKVRQTASEFSSFISSTVGGFNAQVGTLVSGTSYIGINGQKIPQMRNAIREYVNAIQSHLDKVVEDTSTVNAFHGDYAGSVTDYVTAVKRICQDYTSKLLEFSDNLDKIAELYHSKDTEYAANIASTAKNASANSTAYTETTSDRTFGNATSAK